MQKGSCASTSATDAQGALSACTTLIRCLFQARSLSSGGQRLTLPSWLICACCSQITGLVVLVKLVPESPPVFLTSGVCSTRAYVGRTRDGTPCYSPVWGQIPSMCIVATWHIHDAELLYEDRERPRGVWVDKLPPHAPGLYARHRIVRGKMYQFLGQMLDDHIWRWLKEAFPKQLAEGSVTYNTCRRVDAREDPFSTQFKLPILSYEGAERNVICPRCCIRGHDTSADCPVRIPRRGAYVWMTSMQAWIRWTSNAPQRQIARRNAGVPLIQDEPPVLSCGDAERPGGEVVGLLPRPEGSPSARAPVVYPVKAWPGSGPTIPPPPNRAVPVVHPPRRGAAR